MALRHFDSFRLNDMSRGRPKLSTYRFYKCLLKTYTSEVNFSKEQLKNNKHYWVVLIFFKSSLKISIDFYCLLVH